MKSRKKGAAAVAVIFAAALAVVLIIIFGKNNKHTATVSACAKMLALLDADMNQIQASPDCFSSEDSEDAWYEKYMNYMYANQYLSTEETPATQKGAGSAYTYGQLKNFLTSHQINLENVSEATGISLETQKDRTKITIEDFYEVYEYLVAVIGSDNGVHREELVIVGTPSNIADASKWQAYTDNGSYGFEGLALDSYIDRKIQVYVRQSEIVAVLAKISDTVTYNNVWLISGSGNQVTAYIRGITRTFTTDELSAEFSETIGDIQMEKGKVVSIHLKKEKISGKVLMIDQNKVEIEGYGVLQLDENFRAYRTYGIVEEMQVNEILVGYSLTEFVVSGQTVCGAITAKSLVADNIRVLIMATGFTSLFHERVSVTGTEDFTVCYGDVTEQHKAGDIVDLYEESSYFNVGRVTISSDTSSGRLTVLSVEKSYGNPSYRGSLEVAVYDEGLAVVNDVPLEEYLYAVVPSEMPTRFGVEALKVQAVCARSYAYKQLMNNSYSRYGAHVDDSVNFQVYNNVQEHEDAIQAVKETYGQVVAYNGNPVSTYYYSTSCGHTSDLTLWGSDPNGAPYLQAKEVTTDGEHTDLSSEEAFYQFITTTDPEAYDNGFGYYRWDVTLSLKNLSDSIQENLYSRYCVNPSRIQVQQPDGTFCSEEIRTIGDLTKLEVVSRNSGGAVMMIMLYGTKATIRVEGEQNIRCLFGPRDTPITLLKGNTATTYNLPSSFCYFEEVLGEDKTTIEGYHIIGGGYGHGIGMSQNAVSNMVKQGMLYDEIVGFFYEGTELMNVYDE